MRLPKRPLPTRNALFLGFALSASIALATQACGGRTDASPGDPGSSSGSSGASSSGASSSGASSGPSSSSGASSSGASSSGSSSGPSSSSTSSSGGPSSSSGTSSGSSSGGPTPYCPASPPQGACYEDGANCYYGSNGGGCGEQCSCANGQWSCYTNPCPPPPPPYCPSYPPGPGATCSGGEVCNYGNGCGSEQCICSGQYWQCSGTSCPPPSSCPGVPPGNYQACGGNAGSLCDYPIQNNVCTTWECDCYSGSSWNCYETNCYGSVDAGAGSSGGSSSSSGGFGG